MAPVKKVYEIQTRFTYGWENAHHDEDERLIYYDTKEAAHKEIDDLIESTVEAVAMGNMTEPYDPDDYQVVEVELKEYDYQICREQNLTVTVWAKDEDGGEWIVNAGIADGTWDEELNKCDQSIEVFFSGPIE